MLLYILLLAGCKIRIDSRCKTNKIRLNSLKPSTLHYLIQYNKTSPFCKLQNKLSFKLRWCCCILYVLLKSTLRVHPFSLMFRISTRFIFTKCFRIHCSSCKHDDITHKRFAKLTKCFGIAYYTTLFCCK